MKHDKRTKTFDMMLNSPEQERNRTLLPTETIKDINGEGLTDPPRDEACVSLNQDPLFRQRVFKLE